MPDEVWIKTLEDGRKVKFIYQELPVDGRLSPRSLQVRGRLFGRIAKAGNPLSREDVEKAFRAKLSKK